MTHYFLGIDTGATKSHALIADETGRALGFVVGGSGNPEIVGYDGLTQVLSDIISRALAAAGISAAQISGAGFGIAGYDWPSQREMMLEAIQPLGFSAPLELVNDALIGLLAGATAGWGVAVVAGTSCNCWGWDEQRRVGRMTGFGTWMGEGAGGSELVGKALQALALEWTHRGPATRLTPAFVSWAGARSLADLLEGLSLNRYHLSAAAAPLVFQVAAEGDLVARNLITWAGRELGGLAIGVIHQLHFEALDFEVVLAGSFYNGSPVLMETMREIIHAVAPGARLVRLSAAPVVGGVVLGMEQAGLNPAPVRENLIQTTRELLLAEEQVGHVSNVTYDKAALIEQGDINLKSSSYTSAHARLTALYEASRHLHTSLDLTETLHRTIESAVRLVEAERSFIVLPENWGEPAVRATYNLDAKDIETQDGESNYALARKVLERGQSMLLANPPNDSQAPRTMIIVPLRERDETIGALYMDRELQAEQFTTDELALIEALADQAAIAVRNAQMYEGEQRAKNSLRAYLSLELRTPLTAIEGYTSLLLNDKFGPLNDEQKMYLNKIQDLLNGLLTLISELLNFSK